MSEDHIGVQINGVLYVKFEDAKKLREGWDKADREIERLRAKTEQLATSNHAYLSGYQEAIAEIEKLRAALRGVLEWAGPIAGDTQIISERAFEEETIVIARAALGEKKAVG
jgi:hypothetical protein